MKKLMALLCAGILACSMSFAAFAAESPSSATTETTTKGNSTVDEVKVWDKVVVDGQEVEGYLIITDTTTEVKNAAAAQATAVAGADAKVLTVVDVNYVGGSFKSITVPFNLRNVVAGQKVICLHQKHDGSWESITPDKVENGKVTVTFTSLSPVAFVVTGSAAGVASPKTADGVAAAVAVFAVVAFAGAAFTGKKAFN